MAERRPAAAISVAVLSCAYPVVVYLGLTRWDARVVSLAVAGVALLSLAARRERGVALPLAVAGLAGLGVALDQARFVLFVPVLISTGLLAAFGATLAPGRTPMIERFARLQKPALSPAEVRWCRRVTLVWCAFFIGNGLIALTLALAAPPSWWAAYSGGIAYALIGLLLAGEYVLRRRRFGRTP